MQVLTTQAKGIVAVDFVHVDTAFLKRIYALIVVEHGSRRAHLAGITANPTGAWTAQAARNVLMEFGERVDTLTVVLRDRDSRFTRAVDAVVAAAGVWILASPTQAPRSNAICERTMGSLRRELLDQLLMVNERHLRRVLAVYLRHFNTARPHRSLRQLAPAQAETRPPTPIDLANYRVQRRPIHDGLTSECKIVA